MPARLLVAALALLLGSCVATSPESEPPPASEELPETNQGPTECLPQTTAVPKLLRLSNHEYRNMVSDLVGAPVDEALFAHWTPVAEVYGFDTMSETRIDQVALEEQLTTAESLAAIILATPAATAHCPPIAAEELALCDSRAAYSSWDDFSDTQSRECWSYLDSSQAPMVYDSERGLWRKEPDETALLWREGAHPGFTVDVVRRWHSPVTGTATLTVTFGDADAGGGDGVRVSVLINDLPLFSQDLSGNDTTFAQRIPVARGDRIDFIVDQIGDPYYDSTTFAALIDFAPTPRKVAWAWSTCAESMVTQIASRAFRRPLRTEELEDYRTMFESVRSDAARAGFTEPVDHALEATLQAILLSPNFVFKPELVPDGFDAAERSYAIASRLALYFRSSLPDDALWALAASDDLRDNETIREQASRILAQDGHRFATHFGGQWLAYRELGPGELAEEMRAESRDVFATVLSDDLSVEKLLQPGFTVVAPNLADHYGLPRTGADEDSTRVMTAERGGLLSQGAFLERTASGSEFLRAIHRGLWVLTRLLCVQVPRLDPATREEISASLGAIDRNLPLPERMALHRNSATRCNGCHARIDPIGLALENYDERGLWRDAYPDGSPIVSDLELNGVTVRDPHQLAGVVASSADYRNCISEKLLTFAMHRGPADAERCVVERLAEPAPGESKTLESAAVEALIKSIELTEVSR